MQLLSIYRKRQRLWHILFGTIVLLFLLGWLFLTLLVKSPKFQSFLVHTISKAISLNINGRVHIESVDLKFFKTVRINQFLISSIENDTIIFINRLYADISLISIRRKALIIDELNLEGAKINIQRIKQDSLFNIAKLFNTKTETNKNSSQKSMQWILSLKELGLQNSNIYFRDDKNKVSVKTTLKDFKLGIKKMDLKNLIFDFNSLSIVNPNIQIQVNGNTPKDSLPFIIDMPFELALNELKLKEGVFKYDDTEFPIKNNVFDDRHISVREIECFIKNTSITKNEIIASIDNYYSIDNNKYTVQLTNTKFGMNNQSMYLQHLNLKTNHSKIQADAKLKFKGYENFNPIHSMFSFNIQLKKGEIVMKDVQYFLQKPLPLNITDINLTGKIIGSLNNMKLSNIDLLVNKKIIVKGDLLAKNISRIKELEIFAESIFVNATIDDVGYLLPKDVLIPDLVKNLGYINYIGKCNGKINDFNSNGKLNTAIGDLITNLNIKYSYADKTPSYKGLLSFEHINLQKLLQDTLLGFASLNIEIDGKGLVFEDRKSVV